MSFGGGGPSPMVVPPAPQVAPQMTPTTSRPPRKPSQPTMIGAALAGQAQEAGGATTRRTLIGGSAE